MTQQELEKYLWGAATALSGSLSLENTSGSTHGQSRGPAHRIHGKCPGSIIP